MQCRAKLYGLDKNQLRYILDPEEVMDKGYPSETFRVLKNNEEAKFHGVYRTAKLVLDARDKIERREIQDSSPLIVVAAAPILPIGFDHLQDSA
ncbi:MAG TPA: hypothetical protein VHX61_03990 [Rhizomicrobium sp.]|jgi:hypothetical protein|nr:hypothetical protein [Rhizomicrobium sp.]